MKKLVLLLVLVFAWSCSTIDDSPEDDIRFEILPIVSVEDMPQSVEYNGVYTIRYSYTVPNSCHYFNELYYVTSGHIRTVAVLSWVRFETEANPCEPVDDVLHEDSFQLIVEYPAGTYVFNFWQGVDENGVDQYLTYEVPIQ